MKRTNKVSLKRLTYLIFLALIIASGTTTLCYFSNLLYDQIFCILIITVIFILMAILMLIRKRLSDQLPEVKYISYNRIMAAVAICYVIVVLMIKFSSNYFAPFMLIPLILSTVLDQDGNLVFCLYFLSMLSVTQNLSTYEIVDYMLLTAFAIILSSYLQEDDDRRLEKIFANILIIAVNTLIPIIFYYFTFVEINKSILFDTVKSSGITVVVSAILIPILHKTVVNMQTDIYEIILDPSYDLCEDIRKFSFIEYQHALRVSRLSRLCASKIEADEMLAACGGFYYRLGKIEGEPMINNAIKIANDHCFPDDLIILISEYGGIISLPTTKESAIVHMVDSIVTKVELFDADSMSSNWNQNMVIYQTINELSQKGLYDKSGLTMNQFLIIREILANEDILA